MGVLLAVVGFGAPAHGAAYVYATEISGAAVAQFDATSGSLTPLSPSTASTGGGEPLGIAVAPAGRDVYVGVVGPGPASGVLHYAVGADGTLAPQGLTSAAGPVYPESLAVSPNGHSLYVVNRAGATSVLQYTVNADGTLTAKSPASVAATGSGPEDVAVSPDSTSVYVTNDDGTVSQYTAAADGTLSPKTPATVATGATTEPFGVTVGPRGKSVYVADFAASLSANGGVFQFNGGSGGALSAKTPPFVAAAGHLEDLVISRNGRSLYATNANPPSTSPGTVAQYRVGADGRLTPLSPAAVPAGLAPFGLAVSANGRSVYVADEGSAGGSGISQYRVRRNGSLEPRSPAMVPVGGSPYQLAVNPPARR